LRKLRKDVILVIVGSDDGYLARLKRQIKKLRLSDKVYFPGFLSGQDKLSALVDADVVVQPSRYEQALWAPIEAVLCGTPIIVTKNTGAREDVEKMGAGYLVDFGDKKQLVSTLQSILDEPLEAQAKVQAGREYINANLTLNKKVEEYEKLYQECMGKTHRKGA
jgi:glycosyltransferase involved in cell wall biosynthesis